MGEGLALLLLPPCREPRAGWVSLPEEEEDEEEEDGEDEEEERTSPAQRFC